MKRYPLAIFCLAGIVAVSAADANLSNLPAASSGARLTLVGSAESSMKNFVFDADTRHMNGYDIDTAVLDTNTRGSSARQMQDAAITDDNTNKWLTMLAVVGLVALQLRRKHKSLPQRPISNGVNRPVMHG